MKNSLRVASVQFQHGAGDKKANLETIKEFVTSAIAQQVQLIAFPECCLSGYWHLRNLSREELVSLAEPIPGGEMAQSLIELSHSHRITIGVGLVEIDSSGTLYNSYLIAMADGSWRCHRKLHCFISPHMASGDQFTVFDTPHGWRVGVLTCYDNNLIENVRLTALQGAEVLMAPHQTGGCESGSPDAMGKIDPLLWRNRHSNPAQIEAEFRGEKGRGWLMRWLPSRAHDNGMFLIFSNGVGLDDDEVRTGGAMILDPYGRIIVETWKPLNDMVVADLDKTLRQHSTGVRWMKTRRPDLYLPLARPSGNEQSTRTVRFDYLE